MIHVDIGTGARGNKVDWTTTCRGALGDGSIASWKESDAKNARACNMLLTEIQDRFFEGPMMAGVTWFEAAKWLGYKPLSEEVHEDDPRPYLLKLFEVARTVPDAEGDPNFQGQGWKVFHLEISPADIRDAFRCALEACGGILDEDTTWEAFKSIQWVDVLGINGARCMCRKRGRKVGLKWTGAGGVLTANPPGQAA
jgi:hypothetical protein